MELKENQKTGKFNPWGKLLLFSFLLILTLVFNLPLQKAQAGNNNRESLFSLFWEGIRGGATGIWDYFSHLFTEEEIETPKEQTFSSPKEDDLITAPAEETTKATLPGQNNRETANNNQAATDDLAALSTQTQTATSLLPNSVTSLNIKNHTLKTEDLARKSIRHSALHDNAVTARVIKERVIQKEHLAKDLDISTSGTIKVEDLIAENFTVTNGSELTGNLEVTGNLSTTGTGYFGSSLTVKGNILPETASTFNLGEAGTEWAHLYTDSLTAGEVSLTGNLDMNNNLIQNIGNAGTDFTATGGLTLANLLTVSAGGLNVTGDSTLAGDLIPATNDTYDLGSATFRWQHLYLGASSLHLGSATTDEGTFSYDTVNNILEFSTDTTTNGDIAFFTDDLYLDKATGYVGINDTTPTYQLDINGTGRFTGNLDANAGLDVTGDITVGGTVDGKDIATNAAMLDENETIAADWDNSTNPWDIADETNLAVGDGITLTDDTLTVTAGGGLDQTTGGLTTTGVLEDLDTLGVAASDGEFIVATGAGAFAYESDSTARTSLGLGNVEDTKLSTWVGSESITTLGTIDAGTWSATKIATTRGGTGLTSITSGNLLYASGDNTFNELTLGDTLVITTATLNVKDNSLDFAQLADALTLDASTTITQSTYDMIFNLTNSGDFHIQDNGSALFTVDSEGKIGIGDSTPDYELDVEGDVGITGDLTIEGDFSQTCPTGYIWVPGNPKFGTMPGFCVMKYEAKNVDGTATSQATSNPWVSITQESAIDECQALGEGYHLISEAEWMTIAENIAKTPINDLDSDADLQLATGHSDNADGGGAANAVASIADADPVTTGCNLNETMEHVTNAYVEGSCEIRGDGTNGGDPGDANDKGFYDTGQDWKDSVYSSGGANKAQLRTHVLSNGEVIWDLSGNVWEWTDALLNEQDMPTDGSDPGDGDLKWLQWNVAYNLISTLANSRPSDDGWTSTNGIGKLYTWGQDESGTTLYAFLRGGSWSNTSYCGVFALKLNSLPTYTYSYIGFRCAR